MPIRKTHMILGALAGIGYTAWEHSRAREVDPHAEFDYGQLVANTLSSIAGAILPDKLEPATNPNHRGFFHSVAFTIGEGYCLQDIDSFIQNYYRLKRCGNAFFLGHLTHIIADSSTPKGVPLVG